MAWTRRGLLAGLGSSWVVGSTIKSARASMPVGQIAQTKGPGALTSGDLSRTLLEGAAILPGDTLVTQSVTRTAISFQSGDQLVIGDNTRLRVDDLVMNAEGTKGQLSLLRGVFRLVTSHDTARRDLNVTTPLGTIGIRGTDLWGLQGDRTLDLVLISGGPLVFNGPAGDFELTTPLSRLSIRPSTRPVLDTISPAVLAQAARTITF